jgi:hypothetical protein
MLRRVEYGRLSVAKDAYEVSLIESDNGGGYPDSIKRIVVRVHPFGDADDWMLKRAARRASSEFARLLADLLSAGGAVWELEESVDTIT